MFDAGTDAASGFLTYKLANAQFVASGRGCALVADEELVCPLPADDGQSAGIQGACDELIGGEFYLAHATQ